MSLLDKASLIVTPNAVKESKLYSVVPSSGAGDMDVVRATTATRVNSAGLIEEVPYNLIVRSEQFDVSWITNTAVTADNINSPLGIQNADKIQATTTSAFIYITTTAQNSTIYTVSVYAKAGTSTILELDTCNNTRGSYFNLSNGTIAQTINGTASIESVGNGWYRCSVTETSNDTLQEAVLFVCDASGSIAVTSGKNLYLWGAQINQGSLKEYFKTTDRLNVPRIDYTNGSCPSLLVEPQRTNIANYSEDFTNVTWAKVLTTITANNANSPDGTQTADKLIPISSGINRWVEKSFAVSLGVSYTNSCFVKANGFNWVAIHHINGDIGAWFDLSNGTIGTINSGSTASIQSFGNGWYRCSVTKVTAGAVGYNVVQLVDSNNSTTATLSGTNGLLIWGAQTEIGSYATSYIPTVASSVTRNADVISKTGISSLIGQTEGTLFIDLNFKNLNQLGGVDTLLTLNNGTTANEISILLDTPSGANKTILGYIRNASTNEVVLYAPTTITATRYKIALSYKLNDVVLYVNGTQIGTDTSAAIPTTSVVSLNSRSDGSFLNTQQDYINSVQLYKTRLTNSELAQLTTL